VFGIRLGLVVTFVFIEHKGLGFLWRLIHQHILEKAVKCKYNIAGQGITSSAHAINISGFSIVNPIGRLTQRS